MTIAYNNKLEGKLRKYKTFGKTYRSFILRGKSKSILLRNINTAVIVLEADMGYRQKGRTKGLED